MLIFFRHADRTCAKLPPRQHLRRAEVKKKARGSLTAVVVWISAYVIDNLLHCLPSWGLTICMAGRHGEREQTMYISVLHCALSCLSNTTPAPLLWDTGDKERGNFLFQTCQVTLLFIYFQEHPPAILLRAFGDV